MSSMSLCPSLPRYTVELVAGAGVFISNMSLCSSLPQDIELVAAVFVSSISLCPSLFQDIELVAGAGVFVSNMSLVVQKVTRAHGGNYTCEATNVKGTSSSPPLHLDVKCK